MDLDATINKNVFKGEPQIQRREELSTFFKMSKNL